MTHLFKVNLQFADMFISEISDRNITYQVRDKNTGMAMEPVRTDTLEQYGQDYMFSSEKGRSLPVKLVEYIKHTLE